MPWPGATMNLAPLLPPLPPASAVSVGVGMPWLGTIAKVGNFFFLITVSVAGGPDGSTTSWRGLPVLAAVAAAAGNRGAGAKAEVGWGWLKLVASPDDPRRFV